MSASSTPTIKHVAARAGVSLKTVSRVLNAESSVHSETRAKVERAIFELRYEPNPSARSLRNAQSYALGLAYDNPNPYYVIALQSGMLAACHEAGYGLQIHPCNGNSPTLASELIDLVRRTRLAGLVLAPPMSEQQNLLAELDRNSIRHVGIVSAVRDPSESGPCVYIDDRDAAYEITEHLIQLGHQRIGFLWGGKKHRSSTERYQGYIDAMQHYEIVIDDSLIVDGDYAFDDGFRGARKLFALDQRPTAIFASNDEIAAGVLAAAKTCGLEVPYDLSIAGFEDSPFSRQCWPALTTAKQGMEDIARAAARRLLFEIKRRDDSAPATANEGFSPTLVVRGSTMPPRSLPGRREG